MRNRPSVTPVSERHHALVVPMADGYAVSCSCGWNGGRYEASGQAEHAAKGHEESTDPGARAEMRPAPDR